MATTHEVIIQSFTAFIVLFLLARILGKRQIAQLNFFDYIAGITVGNVAAAWSLDDVSSLHAIMVLVIWTALSLFLAFIQRKSYRIRLWLDGKEIILIADGKIMEKNLRKAKLEVEELMEMLRQKDAFKLSDIETAVFENNGQLSVMKKTSKNPVTPTDLNLTVVPEQAPRVVIVDGHLMPTSLRLTGYSKEWLVEELRKQGANDASDVFLGQIDSNGNVYVDLYADTMHVASVPDKPMVAAKLKKLQADLESFALETKNQGAKANYERMSEQLKELIRDAHPFLAE